MGQIQPLKQNAETKLNLARIILGLVSHQVKLYLIWITGGVYDDMGSLIPDDRTHLPVLQHRAGKQ